MEWAFLVAALLAMGSLHLWWRRRFTRLSASYARTAQALASEHHAESTARSLRETAILDSMVEGMLVLDEHHRILMASRAFGKMFQTPPDLSGKTLLEAVRHHKLVELAGSLDEHNRQIDGQELQLDGDRWVGVSGAALFNPQGVLDGRLLVFHDLTRIKKLERIRQEFVANVSHELRTPLSLIKGYAETLLDGAKDNPEVAGKFLQSIDRNAERLKYLIEDLLTISEFESNRVALKLEPVSARALAGKVITDLEARAAARSVRLVTNVPELSVSAEPPRLEQVLVNLVDNAIKYGRQGGTVEVSARQVEPGLVEFKVADDGPGISSEALGRIFERFYREDKARSREQGGTGLGLAIVKHIVQRHGGKAWAQSAPGCGAAFYFTIPSGAGAGTARLTARPR